MQTHHDDQHTSEFMDRLIERADASIKNKLSQITTGIDDEEPLSRWKHKGINCVHLPEDEQKILRISIGGSDKSQPVELDYCNFRGDRGKVINLLYRAIDALET